MEKLVLENIDFSSMDAVDIVTNKLEKTPITQTNLSKKAGFSSDNVINKILKRKRDISANEFFRICVALSPEPQKTIKNIKSILE